MTLAALIRGAHVADSGKAATATPATPATLEGAKGRTVATVAIVAVANLQNRIAATGSDLPARPSTAAQGYAELFTFAPPGDPANDAEALAERAAIMAVENHWSDTQALQEARWQSDRERCWRAFLRNARRVLAAPANERDALLGRYELEAGRLYDAATARVMAQSLRCWVRAKAVH